MFQQFSQVGREVVEGAVDEASVLVTGQFSSPIAGMMGLCGRVCRCKGSRGVLRLR